MLVGFEFRGINEGALPSFASGRDDLLDPPPAGLLIPHSHPSNVDQAEELTSFCVPIWLSDSSSKCLLYPALLTNRRGRTYRIRLQRLIGCR